MLCQPVFHTARAAAAAVMTLADGWSRKFSEAIELPDGERLVTIRASRSGFCYFVTSRPHA